MSSNKGLFYSNLIIFDCICVLLHVATRLCSVACYTGLKGMSIGTSTGCMPYLLNKDVSRSSIDTHLTKSHGFFQRVVYNAMSEYLFVLRSKGILKVSVFHMHLLILTQKLLGLC